MATKQSDHLRLLAQGTTDHKPNKIRPHRLRSQTRHGRLCCANGENLRFRPRRLSELKQHMAPESLLVKATDPDPLEVWSVTRDSPPVTERRPD